MEYIGKNLCFTLLENRQRAGEVKKGTPNTNAISISVVTNFKIPQVFQLFCSLSFLFFKQ